jgi:phosphohistidine phosphatase
VKLYFLRHGLALDRQDWREDDSKRPLTEEGMDRLKRTAATIAALGLELDAILTSPLVRAHQSAEILAAALQGKNRVLTDKRLGPGFDRNQLASILRDHPGTESLMLVGHEPGLSTTVSEVIGGGRIEIKKGGLACIKLIEPHALRGELLWLIPPRLLA